MATTDLQDRFPHTYWPGTTQQAEVERLDGMHRGIKAYLGGKIFLAPLENPRTILDIGTGSGIWAIECAEKFPDAQVTAVDLSPILPRPVPPNFQFQQLDILAEPLPLEAGFFDVVHVRFLLIHLPNPQRALERIARLVKPGGWLLIEELSITGEVERNAPAVRAGFGLMVKYWETSGGDARISGKLESALRETGAFSEVNVHEVVAPVGNLTSPSPAADPKRDPLGLMFLESLRRHFSQEETHPRMLALGLTPELKRQITEELNTLEWQMDTPMHFVWARKSV